MKVKEDKAANPQYLQAKHPTLNPQYLQSNNPTWTTDNWFWFYCCSNVFCSIETLKYSSFSVRLLQEPTTLGSFNENLLQNLNMLSLFCLSLVFSSKSTKFAIKWCETFHIYLASNTRMQTHDIFIAGLLPIQLDKSPT